MGVMVEDLNRNHIFVNRSASELTGYSIEELMAGVWMVHPDDTEAASVLERARCEGTTGSNYETRFVRKDGSEFWVSISWNPIRDESGHITALCTVFADVSDRKQAQAALADASERYEMLVNHVSDIFSEWDLEGNIVYVSPAVSQLGYLPEELVGRSVFELLPDDDRPISKQRLQKLLTDLQSLRRDLRVIAKDGSIRWLEAQVDVATKDGMPTRVYAVHRDVTARRCAEEELARVTDRYKALAENATDILLEWELNGIITYASPSVRLLGYTPEDWIGRHILDFADPETIPDLQRIALQQNDDLRATRQEANVVAKDGSVVCLEVLVSVVLQDGKPVKKHAVARDITERKAAEQARRESERRYKSIVENSNEMIMLTTPQGQIAYVSPACRQINGYEPEELLRDNPWVVHPDDTPWVREVFRLARRGEPRTGVEYRIITKTGETRWVSHSWSPVLEDDQVETVVSVIRDITPQKRAAEALRDAQNALRESDQKYRSIVENSKDLIMLNSPDGVITYASPALLNVLGYEPEELVGTKPNILHPDDMTRVAAAFERARLGESDSNFEYRVITKSGQTRWVSHAWSPVMAADQVQSIISVVRDITERKKSEEQLKKAHEELEQAYHLQREFLNSVTHEVRTPLTAVQGYTEMLMEGVAGPVSTEQAALLQKVIDSSEHLLDVLNAVLQIARMKSGRVALRPRVSDPRLIVDKCVSAVLPQARKKGVSIEVTPDPNGTVATYDEEKLTIIVTNLLGNAIKFTTEGCVEVFVTATPGGCEIIVSDPGIGIDQVALGQIFDEFSQLDYPGKHKPSGFGLGLSIVAAMVEAINASLIVSSKRGMGTAFTLWAPTLEA